MSGEVGDDYELTKESNEDPFWNLKKQQQKNTVKMCDVRKIVEFKKNGRMNKK